MRILYLVDYYQPDIGYNEYYLPKAWSALGHDVTILTSNYYYPFPNYEQTAGKILGPRKHESRTYYQGKIRVIKQPLRFEIFTRAIFFGHEKIIASYRPDLVIVNKSSSFNSFVAAILKSRYKYLLLTYDAHLMSGYNAVGNRKFKDLIYLIYRKTIARYMNQRVDSYIAVQEGTLDVMTKLYGQHPVMHIPLGTDSSLYHRDLLARKSIRLKLKINSSTILGIYTGKVIPTKGVHILFEAFSKISSKCPNLELLIVGDGPKSYHELCIGNLTKAELKRIHFVPFQKTSELYRYYSAADFGVWPLEESTSMNDAAACQLPFIANDEAGVSLRFSNQNALKYRRGDAIDLAKKISQLYSDPAQMRAMGKRGRKLIQSSLTWEVIAKQYLASLQNSLDHHLNAALSWLKKAQDVTKDNGVSAYYSLLRGWAPSFIETTGYIIDTFLTTYSQVKDKDLLKRAELMGDFLLQMQLTSGGYRTYVPTQTLHSEPTIFNTAQDILGLTRLYQHTKNKKYLTSATRACEFLISAQQKDGSFDKYTHNNEPKTYHTKVASALLLVATQTKSNDFRNRALMQLEWAISKQQSNGWVKHAELPVKSYPFTLTHTLAYVAEGFYDSAVILSSAKYFAAAKKIVDRIVESIINNHSLSSYYDSKWCPHEKFGCPTGEAQFLVLIAKICQKKYDPKYVRAANILYSQLINSQNMTSNPNTYGGILGCTPIYGDFLNNRGYCRMCYINWGTKYFVDALLEYKKIIHYV